MFKHPLKSSNTRDPIIAKPSIAVFITSIITSYPLLGVFYMYLRYSEKHLKVTFLVEDIDRSCQEGKKQENET